MPLHECARALLGGWPVGWPPSRGGGVHGLRVRVRDRVHLDVRRARRLCTNVHAGARGSRSRAFPDDTQGGSP
ncbi:MAG: hypothetical protein ACRDTI_15280 [Mycobacterium sp.]